MPLKCKVHFSMQKGNQNETAFKKIEKYHKSLGDFSGV